MLLSRRCEYAIRAVLYLTSQSPDTPLPLHEVSRTLEIPHAFLAKTVRDLVRAEIVATQPGTGGGLSLAQPANALTLKDVVLAIDGPELFEACVLRLPGCGEFQPCPLHEAWVQARNRIDRMLSASTLDTVAAATSARGFRLSETDVLGS